MSLLCVMLLTALALGSSLPAQSAAPREALDGVDPVLLIQGHEVAGKPELKVVRGQFEYLFATPDTKAVFETQPEKYEIQLGGLCARMGGAANGNASDYMVHDGRIYVFGSDDCHRKFAAAPEKYIPRPAPPMPTSTKEIDQGRALIERAVSAIGGADQLDAVTTYVELASQIQKRPIGDVPVSLRTMWRFPDAVRSERTMTIQGKAMTTTVLMTPAGSWFLGQDRVFPQNPAARPATEQDYGRQIVPLLRARHAAGFKAAAVGASTIDGVDLDRVRVQNGSVDVTLALQPTTGQIHSIAFTGRNMDGEIGEYALVYSDYQETHGLRLPFAERALFNGAADSFLTRTIESIAVNTPLEATLFEPATGGK
jgi:YHS domain-containing protein